MAKLENLKLSGNESIFEDASGDQFLFADADINARNILGRNLRFVRGKDINPDVRKRFSNGISLPDQPNLVNIGGGAEVSADVFGIASSVPSVNREDIEKRTREEFTGTRERITSAAQARINEAIGLGEQEVRATEGALGTRRRFSSSAQAFIKFLDDKTKKKVGELEAQRDEALANFDFKLAGLIDLRIKDERNAAQQEFNNALTIIETARARGATPDAEKAKLKLQSDQERAIIDSMQNLASTGNPITIDSIFSDVSRQFDTLILEDVANVFESIGKQVGMKDTNNAAEKLTGDAKNFFLMKEFFPGNLPASVVGLPENEQLGAYIKFIEGGAGGIGGGDFAIGSGSKFEDQALGIRIARAMFGSGRALSDQDREIGFELAEAGQAEGLNELEILKRGLGFNVNRNIPLADNLLEMLIANSEEGLSNVDLFGLATLINKGKDEQAILKAEDIAYREARRMDSDAFTSEQAVRIVSTQVNELMELLDENGLLDEVGTFEGTITKLVTRRLRGDKETEVLNRVENIVSGIRKDLAGVAVTETEMRKLEPLFPDIDQPAESFMTELKNLKILPLVRLNETRGDRDMPRIDEDQLFDRSLRVPLYSGSKQISDDDFFNKPVPTTESDGTYNPGVWESATI